MIDEVLPHIYRIEVPLPQNPLKSLNSYALLSPTRNILIDTGLNRPECSAALFSGMAELGLDFSNTDLVLTHMHADHVGLSGLFESHGSRIFCSFIDGRLAYNLYGQKNWANLASLTKPHGFPQSDVEKVMQSLPGRKYPPDCFRRYVPLVEGDKLEIGEYELHCIATPGHTPGNLCLYEPTKKFLFSSDHILGDITPNISQWNLNDTFLATYLDSLNKISHYEVNLVLPGHRSLFTNCRERIQELSSHHAARNQEILAALPAEQALTAYQIASRISWNVHSPDWERFPAAQKWFATGETLAHLCYLRDEGTIVMQQDAGQITWQ